MVSVADYLMPKRKTRDELGTHRPHLGSGVSIRRLACDRSRDGVFPVLVRLFGAFLPEGHQMNYLLRAFIVALLVAYCCLQIAEIIAAVRPRRVVQ